MEPGEEAEERLQLHQQNAMLWRGLQDAAVWTAPVENMSWWTLTSKTRHSKSTFDRKDATEKLQRFGFCSPFQVEVIHM